MYLEQIVDIVFDLSPGFLERGFICIKGRGLELLILSHFSQIRIETKLFQFHMICKNGGRKGVRENPLYICHCSELRSWIQLFPEPVFFVIFREHLIYQFFQIL